MTKLDELKAAYDELGAKIKEMEEAPKEWPQKGDKYFCLGPDGSVQTYYFNAPLDQGCLAIGNVFRIREEAEAELDARKVIAELRQCEGARAFTNARQNWSIIASSTRLVIRDWEMDFMGWGNAYFDSKETCKAAIIKIGQARIIAAARWLACREVT